MHEIIYVLINSKLISAINIIKLIEEESVNLLKLKVTLIDESLLYITELHTSSYQKYSYHWQRNDGRLIIRWDNTPHWKNIATFPYHKHIEDKILPSHRITVDEVLEIIRKELVK